MTGGTIAWFARNPVAANLLLATILGAGLMTLPRIKREVFPEFASDTIAVSVVYPGAAPEDVEEAICVKIEEEVQGIEGIERVTSTASEGAGTVTIELLEGADRGRALDDVKARIDAIDTFPDDAEEPVVRELSFRRQVLNVAVSGPLGERALKQVAERVRDGVTALPGITQAEVVSTRDYEISIEVAEDSLRRHRTSFEEVAGAVRRGSLDLPGGSLRTAAGEILLRTTGQAYVGADFERIVVKTREDGTRVTVGDVATVVDGFAETDQSARFDGEPAALVQVFRVGDQDALAISAAVRDYCAAAASWLPPGVTLTPWLDQAELLQSRQDLLVKNGLQGFLLVFVVLALFLRFELAVWVSIGIPIAFLGAFALMPWMDVSINMLSLFAFLLVLGIVVDDAIVVAENVFLHSQRGKSGLDAAIDGSREVAVPVTFAVLTSIAAFVPMLAVPGNTGPFWAVIPSIVIPTLAFSLVESKLILPAHLRHLGSRADRDRGPAAWWRRFQGLFSGTLEAFAIRLYRPSLELALRHRYVTLAAAVGVFAITIGGVAGGYVRFVFFPPVDGDNVVATLTMPPGTPVEATAREVLRIEQAALELRDRIARETGGGAVPPIRHVLTAIGEQPYRKIQEEGGGRLVSGGFAGSRFGEVNIQLAPSELRSFSSDSVADRWRELVGPVHGASALEFSSSLISVGADLDIRLRGADLDRLEAAAERLKQHLATIDGVYDISDSFEAGSQELALRVRPEAEALGLTLVDLARQVRQGFHGEEAQRVQRGRDDVKVMVRYPEAERRALVDVETMRIRTPSGDEVPFETVADASLGRGFSMIRRSDRAREIAVTAEVDETANDVNAVVAELSRDFLPALVADEPGLRWAFEGERKEQQETMGGLAGGFAIALLLIYVLIAIPFKSYLQPLVVMAAIPFGLIGAVIGHLVMGMDLSVLSACGLVALAGVVVNDSLVLVDFVNRSRSAGGDVLLAVRDAGVRRFRPILLTSLTTFAGLTPLLLEKSVQALFLVPMAISLAFGVMFATFISLVLVPAGYLILEDLGVAARWLYGRRGGAAGG